MGTSFLRLNIIVLCFVLIIVSAVAVNAQSGFIPKEIGHPIRDSIQYFGKEFRNNFPPIPDSSSGKGEIWFKIWIDSKGKTDSVKAVWSSENLPNYIDELIVSISKATYNVSGIKPPHNSYSGYLHFFYDRNKQPNIQFAEPNYHRHIWHQVISSASSMHLFPIPPELAKGIPDSLLEPKMKVFIKGIYKSNSSSKKITLWDKVWTNKKGTVDSCNTIYWSEDGTGCEEAFNEVVNKTRFEKKQTCGYYGLCLISIDLNPGDGFSSIYYKLENIDKPPEPPPELSANFVAPESLPTLVFPKQAPSEIKEAYVSFDIKIDKTGKVTKAKVITCNYPVFGFEEAASKAITQATFPIREEKGKPVSYNGVTKIVFSRSNGSDSLKTGTK